MSHAQDIIANDEQSNEQELAAHTAESMATLKKRSVKGVLSYAFRTLALQGIAFGANILLGYYLSPSDFGIFFLVSSVVGLFTFLSDIGLAAALVQKPEAPTLKELRTTFTVQQMLAVTIFAVVVALTPIWQQAKGFGATELMLLYALAFSFVLASLKTIPSILLERELHFDRLVIPAVIENLVFYGVTVFLASRQYGVQSYTWAVLARGVLGVIAIYAMRPWSVGFAMDRASLKRLLSFGAKFQLNDLLARVKDDLFVVVLSRWLSPTDLGYVSWAKRWSMFPYQLSVNSVMSVTFPTFARLQHDTERLRKAIEKSMYFITLAIFPLLIGMSLFIFPLVELFEGYHKWRPALWSLVFFAINIGWSALSTPLTNTLNAIGQINQTLKLMVLWTILTWTVTPAAIWFFGYVGVALASAAIGITALLTVSLVKKVVPIRVWPQVWRQLLASAAMITVGLIGQSFWSQSFLWLGAGIVITGVAYLATFLIFGWKSLHNELSSLGITA